MKTVPQAMFVLTKDRIPITRLAYTMRDAADALEYAQLSDLANRKAYGMRRIAVWIPKGIRPTCVGLAGRKWQFDDHRKVVR